MAGSVGSLARGISFVFSLVIVMVLGTAAVVALALRDEEENGGAE